MNWNRFFLKNSVNYKKASNFRIVGFFILTLIRDKSFLQLVRFIQIFLNIVIIKIYNRY